MSGHAPSDPRKLPVAWKDRPEQDLDYHQREWTSGTRGGGAVPADFSWPTNPKQQQEEHGSGGGAPKGP